MGFDSEPGAGNQDTAKTRVKSSPELSAATTSAMHKVIDIENAANSQIAGMLAMFSSIQVDQPNMIDKEQFLADIQAKIRTVVDDIYNARQKHKAAHDAENADRESRQTQQ